MEYPQEPSVTSQNILRALVYAQSDMMLNPTQSGSPHDSSTPHATPFTAPCGAQEKDLLFGWEAPRGAQPTVCKAHFLNFSRANGLDCNIFWGALFFLFAIFFLCLLSSSARPKSYRAYVDKTFASTHNHFLRSATKKMPTFTRILRSSSRNTERSLLFTLGYPKVPALTRIGGALVAKHRTVITFGLANVFFHPEKGQQSPT